MKISRWLVPCAALVICPAVIALLLFTKPRRKSWTEEGRTLSSSAVLQKWQQIPIEPLGRREALREQVQRIPLFSKETALSADQEHKLRASIEALLTAYSSAEYSEFVRFSCPTPDGKLNQSWMNGRRGILLNAFPDRREISTATTESLFKLWFEYSITHTGVNYNTIPERLKTGVITGISLAKSSIHTELRTTKPEPFEVEVTKGENNGVFTIFSTFIPSYTDLDMLKEGSAVMYAKVELFLGRVDSKSQPYYLRLYWDSQHSVWIPSVCCLLDSGPRTAGFIGI